MKTKIKTFEVTYILGYLSPIEKKIKIQTINDLTENFIRDEIIRQYPNQKNFIMDIISTLLIEEKFIGEDEEEIRDNNKDKDIPIFNWNG